MTMFRRFTLAALLLGLLLRGYHYLREPALWHDEAALVLNVIDLDYSQMFGALLHHEAAPPLFLLLERGMVDLFGDSLQVLRFLPFLASCLALLLFVGIARRSLPEEATPLAVLLFAVSDRLLWHCCEAKPYAIDCFLMVLSIDLWQRTRHLTITKQSLLWLPLLPAFVWLSFPGCFIAGGVLLTLLVGVWHSRRLRDWGLASSVALAVGISFVLLALGPAKAQRDGAMESCWMNQFPNWSQPLKVPFWSLFSTLEVIRYNVMPVGHLLSGFVLLGAIWLWRRGERSLLVLLLGPWLLGFIAACLHRYPYGSSRIIAYLAPTVILLLAGGILPTLDYLRRFSRGLVVGTVLFLLVPAGWSLYRVAVPWHRADTASASECLLQHHQPSERILINHWEFEYYLRGRQFENLTGQPLDCLSGERFWFIGAGTDAQKEELIQALKEYAEPINRFEYDHAFVVEFRGR
jgi:hypothetical protein